MSSISPIPVDDASVAQRDTCIRHLSNEDITLRMLMAHRPSALVCVILASPYFSMEYFRSEIPHACTPGIGAQHCSVVSARLVCKASTDPEFSGVCSQFEHRL